MQRILVIAAHPDDEVLGMGATIAKHTANGDDVALLIVTDGCSAQYRNHDNIKQIIQRKKAETAKCASILGIKKIYYGNLVDMKLDTVEHIVINEVIEQAIKDFTPTVVYTHFGGDINKDHRCVYESTLVACRPTPDQCVKKIFAYSVPSSTEWNVQDKDNIFTPNWYEDTSNFTSQKYEGFSCYETEMRSYPHPRSIEYIKLSDTAEGLKVGLQSAESFILLRCLV